ncbi:MAG: rhomboid family intramembrane serine protease [Verrucomicrobiales bacterium]|nr:rhomboid family intramembrane serine protease [Verrucomicrobiales bacterium]
MNSVWRAKLVSQAITWQSSEPTLPFAAMSDEADSAPTHPPANTALAARYGSAREAFDHALVILAMNLPYWHVHQSGSHELYVEEERLGQVADELRAYRQEQASWRPVDPDAGVADYPASFYVPYVATLILTLSFILQNAYAPYYATIGRMDTLGFLSRNEWWRPLTALFLHADVPHVLGNIVFGLWYGTLVNRTYGTLLGWSLMLASGILGNTLVALHRFPASHFSIGASTAVFGALGLLVAEGFAHRWRQRFSMQVGQLLIPMVAGGLLLGWTGGFHDPQIDGLAHVGGFLSGFMLGLAASFLPRQEAGVSK